jgi:hypothetical protein
MYIPRFLVLSLLMSVWVARVVAQSPSENIPGSFYSEPASALPQGALASVRLIPIQPAIDIDIERLYLRHAKSEVARADKHDWAFKAPSLSRKRVLSQDDVTCLSIRSYRVMRDDPRSDTTRLVGYSTCQPATKFQVKEAGERQDIVPR